MASLYAVNADFTALVDYTITDAGALTKLLEHAERDIDNAVGPWGIAYTVGSHTLPTGTVSVASTDYLPSTGSVTIGGQTVTYTGKTQTTLTGATGGTGTFAAGAVVMRVLPASGLKFDPLSQLSAAQQLRLKRATVFQAEYRDLMGPEFFVQAQFQQVSGPDFSQTGRLPHIAPKAIRELQGFGLLLETCVG